MGRRIGVKAVRTTIAVVGLLVLRLILAALPMLKHPMLYPSSPAAFAGQGFPQAIGDITIQQLQQAFAQALGAATGGQNLAQYAQSLMEAHFAIFPITIAKAVVDTLIFLVLLLFGRDLGSIVRSGSGRVPEMGPILNFGMMAIVVALAYHSYQGVLYPFLWPSNVDLYGWIFLVLGLAPLVGIVVLVSRNMDAITSVVMHAGGTAAVAQAGGVACPSCGQAVAIGAKFCPHCAAPVRATGRKFCPSCGADNSATAKFCGGCGRTLAG